MLYEETAYIKAKFASTHVTSNIFYWKLTESFLYIIFIRKTPAITLIINAETDSNSDFSKFYCNFLGSITLYNIVCYIIILCWYWYLRIFWERIKYIISYNKYFFNLKRAWWSPYKRNENYEAKSLFIFYFTEVVLCKKCKR